MTISRVRDRRRGTAYLIVVGAAMMVGVMTFGILQTSRARNRTTSESMDSAIARQCALDGIEAAKIWIRTDSNWRINRPAGVWASDLAMGNGIVTIEASDPVDGLIAKGQHDALLLKSTGKKNAARSIVSVTLRAEPIPLDALAYAALTDGELHVLSGKTLKAAGSTVATNDAINNQGTITGGVYVKRVTMLGTVTGSPITINSPKRQLPAEDIIDRYMALGTIITPPATIDKVALGPGHNPFGGGTNADGIYVINASGDVTIKNSRIFGTLVIVTANRKVILDGRILLQPSHADQPTLLIKGDAEFIYQSDGATLSETLNLTNFNPAGAPYIGSSDILILDSYPSEVQGLVHVTGKLTMKQTARIRGAVMVGSASSLDAIKIEDTPELIYTPSLFTNPPQWYTKEVRMPILPGSWLQPAN